MRITTIQPSEFTPVRTERYETVVIGAGQAGLATGHELSRRDGDFLIIDRDARIGDGWRRRWDSLRLFTPAAYSGLPGMPFPAPPAHLPDKDEVADYLERYAERFDLPVRLSTPVTEVRLSGDRFTIDAGGVRLEADNVVVATGPFQQPRIPEIARQLDAGIRQLHSSAYHNPFDLPDGPVLVVGAGNSGAQIAMEVARFRKVWLAGRDTGHIPRRFLGRDIYDWLWPLLTRFTIDTRIGRRLRERAKKGDSLVGIPERDLVRAGVQRVGRVTGVRDGRPVAGSEVLDAATIIWSTGYDPDYSWIDLPITDGGGRVNHSRGVVAGVPGLYFVGLRFQYRMTSALIGGVGADAAFIAEQVAQRAEVTIGA
jgi:putative flavoprotein involved in K+ transport